ncbi:probable E3 ubiquitin-protein ligase TRIML1 [Sarcophilus harrisii]|uniref:probable E3 ubiquitin-protein ligase TRIML1 n=1 Tax=Sarcophilus harrisii TaxID=9305 RepID=UPI000273A6E3|nr:probable E3 ubiquitin-protein ligase TRIML1 [Sarcophilus harrisii]
MEAAAELLKELQSNITCKICRGYFSKPITIQCGHSFCGACLSLSWRVGTPAFPCPECRQIPQDREIPQVNRCLAELTEQGKEFCSKLLESTKAQSQCTFHKKRFKLFCEDDHTALCVTCCETPEHGAHKIFPIKEAAHHYRKKLQVIRSHLGKHFEKDKKLLAQEERPDWKGMIIGEYFKAYCLLMEENSQSLERLKQEEKARQDRISHQMQTLQDLKLELREAVLQPNLDVLQNAKQLLRRTEVLLAQWASAVTSELRACPIPGIMEMLNRFRVDLTLDPRSADSYVTVSEDLKSVKAATRWQVETKLPKDFPCHYVFAKQTFSSGKQYWEVDVTQLPQWILGIYTPHFWSGMDRIMDCSSPVFLLRCIKKEQDYYLQTYPGLLNYRVKDPIPRVGIYLEFGPGTIAFYNVLQRSLIYKFCPILFSKSVPFFSPGPPLSGTKLGPMTLCPVDSHLCACCYSCL